MMLEHVRKLEARLSVVLHDAVALQFALGFASSLDFPYLIRLATSYHQIDCFPALLKSGASWDPDGLLYAATDKRLDVLEVVLRHSKDWSPRLPGQAAMAGNFRFLMRSLRLGALSGPQPLMGSPLSTRE
jgi:hypothetical protein